MLRGLGEKNGLQSGKMRNKAKMDGVGEYKIRVKMGSGSVRIRGFSKLRAAPIILRSGCCRHTRQRMHRLNTFVID